MFSFKVKKNVNGLFELDLDQRFELDVGELLDLFHLTSIKNRLTR